MSLIRPLLLFTVFFFATMAYSQSPVSERDCQIDLDSTSITPSDLKAKKSNYEVAKSYYKAKNYQAAYKYYLLAAKQGDKAAYFRVGYMLGVGRGTKVNKAEALKWFLKAAENGNKNAQFNVASYYRYGIGTSKNLNKAISWYKKCAAQGDEDAKKALKELQPEPKPEKAVLASIKWIDLKERVEQKEYQLNVDLISNCKIEEYKVTLNGKKVSGNAPVSKGGHNWSITRSLSLQNGENLIEVSVKNSAGWQKDSKIVYSQQYELCSIDWLNFPKTTKEQDFVLNAGIKSKSKVTNATVFLNGKEVNTRGIAPVKDDGYAMVINRNLSLNEGENAVKISVTNAGGESSDTKTITYIKEVQRPKTATIDWIGFTDTTSQKKFLLKAGVKSKSKITDVKVLLNGKEVENSSRGIAPVKDDGFDMHVNRTLLLDEGKNKIEIIITNAEGENHDTKTMIYQKEAPKAEQSDRRIALVIGNASYPEQGLANPENDASDFAKKLKSLGFDVDLKLNENLESMINHIAEFCNNAKNYDVALFYYAGHGIQHQGENYLIPVNAKLVTETRLEYESVNMNWVLEEMENSKSKMKIVILDACRNTPFERRWHRGQSRSVSKATGAGLANMKASGTLIAYSTNPGNVAYDGEGRNSPYTAGLLKMIDEPNVPVELFFKNVRRYVKQQTKNAQEPWESSSIEGDFYFNKK